MKVLDSLDKSLLRELCLDSRRSTAELARKVRKSREVILYRMNRLAERSIVQGYVTEIPYTRLGFVGGALFLSIKQESALRFEKYLQSHPRIGLIANWSGRWTHGMSCFGADLQELDAVVAEIRSVFAPDIRDSKFLVHADIHYCFEKLFGGSKPSTRNLPYALDPTDRTLLRMLATDSRIDASTLALAVGLTGPAVATRIRRLESSGVIAGYGVFLNLKSLGYCQYSVWIENKSEDSRRKLRSILFNHPSIHFICTYVGEYVLEFGVAIFSQDELRPILLELENAVPESRVLEAHVVADDLVSFAPPAGLLSEHIKGRTRST